MNNVIEFREFIRKEASKLKTGEKLAVVAHSQVLTRFTCQEFNSKHEPVSEKSIKFQNCEIVEWEPVGNTFRFLCRK